MPASWFLAPHRPPNRRNRRPWRAPLALFLLVNAGAIGYRISEGWDWGDCYWMVLISLSTLGFSDGHTQILSAAGRLVTTLLILGGLVVVQISVQGVLGLSESGYFRRLRERQFHRWLLSMDNHVILCGYGRIGHEIAEQLTRENVPIVVVEMDSERKDAAEERGLAVISADATLDETLLEAGIHRCRALVAALPNNASNLYVVLSARGIAPNCRLIARSDSEEAERKLRLAGADQVVSPFVSGGRAMAATALRPLSVTFMDLLVGSGCEVEEFLLSNDPSDLGTLDGASLADLQLGARTGVLVLAIVPPKPKNSDQVRFYRGTRYVEESPALIANPGSDTRLAAGQMLVVMGNKQQLENLTRLLGQALISVDAMSN
ncbi:MAG: potassium channel protein [Cyanobium sp.]